MHLVTSLLLLGASVALAAEADPVAPHREFAGRWQQYHERVKDVGWETVFEGRPAKPFWGEPTFRREVPREVDNNPPTVTVTGSNDTAIVTFVAEQHEQAFLPVGPKVKGDFALEIVCQTTSQNRNDLSLVLTGLGAGPAFQFGGYRNTRNLLIAVDGEGAWKRQLDLPCPPRIEKDKWHTVRLAIRDGELSGVVDGQLLGTTKLGAAYPPEREWQPLFYIYDSAAAIKSYRVLRPKADGQTREKLWREMMGDGTVADVDRHIAELIRLLDHDQFRVRQGAQEVLRQFGPAARAALQAISQTGTVEQAERARELLASPPPAPVE